MEFFDNISEKLAVVKSHPVFSEYISEIKKFFEEEKDKPVPPLDYKTFIKFFENGDRLQYEGPYFYRRKRITAAVLLYLLYEKEEYMDEICNMIWIICSEITWVLPAHIHLGGEGSSADYAKKIDLFSAETGRALSEIYYILGDKLPVRIRDIIKHMVNERIFKAFEEKNHVFETKTNNWAAVCGGSVGMAYMYLAPERFNLVKARLLDAMNCFVSSYGDDGCCTEGVGYWYYGFGYYIYFADALYRFTDGKIDIRHSEKIDKMARFAPTMILRKNVAVSFSDSQRKIGFGDAGLMCYLAKNYDGISMPPVHFGFKGIQGKLSINLRKLLWTDPELLTETQQPKPGLTYFDSAKWYINRKEKYSFAAKAGHNKEEHNHNDVGSFIFADDNGQILVDIGAMLYTRQNFSPERYTLLQNSSLGHNVPIIDGRAQQYGREFCGSVLTVTEDEFTAEIQGAYGENTPKIVRSFKMRESGITLTDTFDMQEKHDITERFVSVLKPEITDNGVKIGNAVIKADGTPKITEETLINHFGKPETFYLIDYKADKSVFTLTTDIIG